MGFFYLAFQDLGFFICTEEISGSWRAAYFNFGTFLMPCKFCIFQDYSEVYFIFSFWVLVIRITCFN